MSNLVRKLMYSAICAIAIGNSLSYVHKPELTFKTQEYRFTPSKKDVCDLKSLISQEYVKLNRKQFIPNLENAKSIIQVGLFEPTDLEFDYPHSVYNFQRHNDFLLADISGPRRNLLALVYKLENKIVYVEFKKKGFKPNDFKKVIHDLTKTCPSIEEHFMNTFEDNEVNSNF